MGKKAGKKEGSHGPKSVVIPLHNLERYVEVIHKTMNRFRHEWQGWGGASQWTWRRMLRTGSVGEETALNLVEFLNERLDKAYEKGYVTPEQAPKISSIYDWPMPVLTKVEAQKHPGGVILSKYEFISEMCNVIARSKKGDVLYACIGTGSSLRLVLETLGDKTRPPISRIVMRVLSSRYIMELSRLGLVTSGFLAECTENASWVSRRGNRDKDGVIDIDWQNWEGMSPLHGMKYGDVIVYGFWQYGARGLNTVDGPMYRLTRDDGKDFENYSKVFEEGDVGWQRQPLWEIGPPGPPSECDWRGRPL